MAVEIIIAGTVLTESEYNKAVLKYVDPTLTDDNIYITGLGLVESMQYAYDNFSAPRPIVVYTYSGIDTLQYHNNYFYPHVQLAMPFAPNQTALGNLPTVATANDTRGIINVSGGVGGVSDWYKGSALEFTEEANGQGYANGVLSQWDVIESMVQHSATKVRFKTPFLTPVVAEGWKDSGKYIRIHISGVAGFSNNPNGAYNITDAYYPPNFDPPNSYDDRYVEFTHELGAGSLTSEAQVRIQYMSGAVPTAVAKLNQIRKQREANNGSCSWWEARQCARLTKVYSATWGYGEIDVASAVAYAGAIPADSYTTRVTSVSLSQSVSEYKDEYGTVIGDNRSYNLAGTQSANAGLAEISGTFSSSSGYGSANLLVSREYADLSAWTVTGRMRYVNEVMEAPESYSFQYTVAPDQYDFTDVMFIKWKQYGAVETNVQHEETTRTLATITAYNEFTNNLLKYFWADMATIATVDGAVTINLNHVRSCAKEGDILYVRFDRYTLRVVCLNSDYEYRYLKFLYYTKNRDELYQDRTRLYVSQIMADERNVYRSLQDALDTVGDHGDSSMIIVEDGTYPEIEINHPIMIELKEGVTIYDSYTGGDTHHSTVTVNIPAGEEVYIMGAGAILSEVATGMRSAIRNLGAGTTYIEAYSASHVGGRAIVVENGWLLYKINRGYAGGGWTFMDSDGVGNYDGDANYIDSTYGLLFNQDLAPNLVKIHRHMFVSTSTDSGVVSPASNDTGLEYWFIKVRMICNMNPVIYFFATPPSDARMRLWDCVMYSDLTDYNIADESGGNEYLRIYPYGTLYSNKGIYPNPYTLMYGQLTDY